MEYLIERIYGIHGGCQIGNQNTMIFTTWRIDKTECRGAVFETLEGFESNHTEVQLVYVFVDYLMYNPNDLPPLP